MQTMKTAQQVADVLIQIPQVEEVLLFGSVARNGEGNDLDVALVVPEHIFAIFLTEAHVLAMDMDRRGIDPFSYRVNEEDMDSEDFLEWVYEQELQLEQYDLSRRGGR